MYYGYDWNQIDGYVYGTTPQNVGLGTTTPLYTGSGPLWRSKIVNWEGEPDNSASNPSPQPNPDPCVKDPTAAICL